MDSKKLAASGTMNLSSVPFEAAVAGVALITILVLFSLCSRTFGSQAIERWARANGWLLVRARRRSFVPHWRWCSFSKGRFQFFRVTVRDVLGADHKAWMRLESDCTQPEILDIIWDNEAPPATQRT